MVDLYDKFGAFPRVVACVALNPWLAAVITGHFITQISSSVSNIRARIEFQIPDIFHTFRRGHRVMIHVQSSWFPLVDRNPQTFVNIPTAKPEDYRKATQRVYHAGNTASGVTVMVLPAGGK